ncbi:MAG: hypothetical protein R3C53_12215 [Pirellulaceae bacterium]
MLHRRLVANHRWPSALGWRFVFIHLVVLLLLSSGCHRFTMFGNSAANRPPPPVSVPLTNPHHIPAADPDFLWNQVVDSVDTYFRIKSEQPVRRSNTNWIEGRLSTYPEVSGTTLEPWRRDAARGFERLQSTFQTIRRTATVRVIPEDAGYSIEVQVLKEQEDVDQSQVASAGSAAQRHDGTIIRNENQLRQLPLTLGWFEIGRDRELEQRIMSEIIGKLTHVGPPRKGLLH